MQTRLTRSRTESIIGGVCGGLGEYFGVDPVMVRFIFVLVTFTSGLGLPVYLLLWVLMPRQSQATASPAPQVGGAEGHPSLEPEQVRVPPVVPYAQYPRAAPPEVWTASQAMPPYVAPADPGVLQAGWPEVPSTGKTIRLEKPSPFAHDADFAHTGGAANQAGYPMGQGQEAGSYETCTSPSHSRPRDWRKLGLILIGLGALIIVNHFVSMAYIFPSLLIIAGIMLLRRSRPTTTR
ncbi:MAG: PspC domain-containing protein [Chloroflexaceae bacterium]|nr:PspC domain-containing protein [Chloroflexaceae bacterium]